MHGKRRVTPRGFQRSISCAGLLALIGAIVVDGERVVGSADAYLGVLFTCVLIGDLLPVVRRASLAAVESTPGAIFAFAILLRHGPVTAALAMALGSAASDLLRRKPAAMVVANAAQWTLTWTAAGLALVIVGEPSHHSGPMGTADVPPIALAGLAAFAVNYALISSYLALRDEHAIGPFLRTNVAPAAAEEIAALCLGAMIAIAGAHVAALPLLALPFVLCIGERRNADQADQALVDPLTRLPNRVLFVDRALQAIRRSQREQVGGALLLVDLDGFKQVNDTLGHNAGDELLRLVAERLQQLVRATDTVARLGGDEFGVLLVGDDGDESPGHRVSAAIEHALTQPFALREARCTVGASVGIAAFPADGAELDLLLEYADAQMYGVKRQRARSREAPTVAV
ncbi:MAG TPA: GGDEF domain-containing protein [Conexibacter sp.]